MLRRLLLFLALLFCAVHVAFLSHTLEDIDSVNFALGVESFDVAKHQPHPPGYPVYIGLTKLSTSAIAIVVPGWDRDRRATVGIAIWSVLLGTLALFVLADLWRRLGLAPPLAATAAIVTVTAPLFWFMAARPLTDVPGLVAAVAVQAMFLRGRIAFSRSGHAGLPREWLWAAAGAGFVVGLRVQTLLLTGPLLLWAAGELVVAGRRVTAAAKLAAAAAAGVLVWALPLLWDSGGIGGYLRALGGQGQEDFADVSMLATVPSLRLLQQTMRHTFVDPWSVPTLAHVIGGLALIGLVRVVWKRAPSVAPLLAAFLPYLVFHFLFHETAFVRYALPLLVPVCGLAVVALSALGTRAAIAGGAAIATASLIIVQPHLQAYARNASPEFDVFRDMQRARHALAPGSQMPLLRTHHQVWHVVRRTIDWYRPVWDVGPQPFPSDREWQRLVRHWVSGGTETVWLLGDLSRNDVRLFDRRTTRLRGRYALDPAVRELMGGVRLAGLNWWEIERPRWMLGTGWSLTPEIAGMTSKDKNGPHLTPADAFIRRAAGPLRIMIGARYLEPGGPPGVVDVALDGAPIASWPIAPAAPWFVEWIDVPQGIPQSGEPYARLTAIVRSTDPARPAPLVGLEQFDAAPLSDLMYAFLDDWNELEGNPRTGQLWRWTTARSTLLVQNVNGADRRLILEGDDPLRDHDRAPTVVVKAGDRELARFSPAAAFTQDIAVPAAALAAAGGRLTIETDLTFVPGDRQAVADRRVLGLRLFRVEVR